jgi:glutamyl-tRNA reductase
MLHMANKRFQGLADYPFEPHLAELIDFEGVTCTSELDAHDATERMRARETERVLRKLNLSLTQAQAVERFSCALVDRLIHGPIARVASIIEGTSRSTAAEKVWRERSDR